MRIIFSHNIPYFLAHGGSQTVIDGVMRELAALGEQVEHERWWDESQAGDILHYVGPRPPILNVRLAQQKGFKVVMTEFLDMTSSRSRSQLLLQRTLTRLGQRLLPGLTTRLSWDVYRELDAMIFCAPLELEVARYLFSADVSRGHIIGYGLETDALAELAKPQAGEDHLVCLATIHPRKNSVLLARAARLAEVPVVFAGRPYAEDDPYFKEFKALVDGKCVRYAGFISREEKHRLLRSARGFVLLSQYESGCIAVYEASAAGLPLLLSDLPWATKGYPQAEQIRFVQLGKVEPIAAALKEFHAGTHRLSGHNFPVLSWRGVAQKYLGIYRELLGQKSP